MPHVHNLGHFQIIHIHTTVINSGRATLLGTAQTVGVALTEATILADAAVTPYRLRNDQKCVEWDVKPYNTHTASKVRVTGQRRPIFARLGAALELMNPEQNSLES